MQVTFTNAGSTAVFLSSLYSELQPGGSITTRRSLSDLDRDQRLKELVEAGTITLAFAKETGDDASLAFPVPPPVRTNANRGSAADVPVFSFIWNTDDNAPNWSDGTNWRDAAGSIT